MKKLLSNFLFLIIITSNLMLAKEYYVALNGSDANPGSKEQPFRTIQKAADIMQPGDICIVREGLYREWIKPKRGGTSENNRIVYKAAPGEKVIIRGSEVVTNWVRYWRDTWRIEIPDSIFGSFNPFKTNISGGWIRNGREYHLGDLYLNGKSFREQLSFDGVAADEETFFIESREGLTVLYANFGNVNPNRELTEINVRECVFFPEIKGLRYITVDGFTMQHAAANWTCFRAFQRSLIGTYWGRNWIIQNCTLTDARCTALVCGNDPSREDEAFDADSTGHHIIRNNVIRNCGQAGITGFKGWAFSTIEGNLIEEINAKKEFGGYETGGIKLHDPVDVIIKNNVIRKVYVSGPGQYAGIWLDWGVQGTRVTGNIVYDMEAAALFLQNAHGPVFVDNNIFSGEVRSSMGSCVYVHNLFVDCNWNYQPEPRFSPVFWKPHSGTPVKLHPNKYENDKNLNNIYVGIGTEEISNHPGFEINWNIYYEGAKKSTFGDKNSIIDNSFSSNVYFKSLPNGVEVSFIANNSPYDLIAPLITYDLIGVFELTGQGMEDRFGKPYSIDVDLLGNKRNKNNSVAGPIEKLNSGLNTIKLTLK